MMKAKQKIIDFGRTKCIWVTITRKGIVYHGREDYKTGRPAYKRVKSNLEQAILANTVLEAQ